MTNFGQAIGDFLGFDPTPGFNLRSSQSNPVSRGLSPWVDTNSKSGSKKTASTPNNNNNQAAPTDVYSGGGGSGSSYGGGSAPVVSQADLAYLDDQENRLRSQDASANRAQDTGLAQLVDSYLREKSKANENQSRALQDFATKREDTTRGKDQAINKVDTSARTLAEGLRRKIGMASGANSSAYKFAAPQAVAKQASDQRGEVVENYGVNFRNLDTGEKRVKSDFETLLQDLEEQRNTREREFRSGILERKNAITNSLSEVARQRALAQGGGYDQVRNALAPYTAQIDSRQGEINSLFDRYRTPFAVKEIDTKTPDLRDYTVDRATINANSQQGTDPNSPYGQLLRKEDEDPNAVY